MRNPYELFAGLRYTRARRSNRAISFISAIAILCMAIGGIALITVMSVMNGFERELRTRILGMASHATISGYQSGLEDWPAVAALAEATPEVEATAPYIEGEGMLRVGGELTGTLLRGVVPERENRVSEIGARMAAGQLESLVPGAFNIVIGYEIAQALGLAIGDRVDLMIPQASVTPAGVLPRFRRFTVSGVFRVGMYEFDRGLAIVHLADAQALLRMGDAVTGLRLKLHDLYRAPVIARQINAGLGDRYFVSDWTRSHANFFRAVATEKTVMFIILSLIVLVAVINIVSTLTMVVQEKQADIAILRTLGATPRSVMAIFVVQGLIIGVVGTALGTAGGVALALNVETLVPILQQLTGQQFLSPDVYYISDLPSELKLRDVVRVGTLSLTLGLLSTLYPALRASRVQPAEALRYE